MSYPPKLKLHPWEWAQVGKMGFSGAVIAGLIWVMWSLLFGGCMVAGSGCASRAVIQAGQSNGVPNLRLVEPGIYRGGQPTQAGWNWLFAHGVNNVIKLNEQDESSDWMAVRLGMTLHYYPIDTMQQLVTGPSESQIRAALMMVRDGTFIHCDHGQDRTGVLVYCYRLQEGWTPASARAEMMTNGFHKALVGLEEFTEHWRN